MPNYFQCKYIYHLTDNKYVNIFIILKNNKHVNIFIILTNNKYVNIFIILTDNKYVNIFIILTNDKYVNIEGLPRILILRIIPQNELKERLHSAIGARDL